MPKIMLKEKDYSAPSVGGGEAESAEKWATQRNINGMMIDGTANRANYVSHIEYTSDDNTIFISVTCDGFVVSEGAEIAIQFMGYPVDNDKYLRLSINNTEYKSIWYMTESKIGKLLSALRTYIFRYHGYHWQVVGDLNDHLVRQNMIGLNNNTYSILFGNRDRAKKSEIVASTYANLGLGYNPARQELTIGDASIESPPDTTKTMQIKAEQDIVLMSDVVEVVDKDWKPSEIAASAFTIMSSRRYKENVMDMAKDEAEKILQLRPVKYDYINKCNGIGCYGLIAEEVDEVMAYPVSYDKDGAPKALDYSKFVPHLIKMVQLQEKEIEDLKKRLEALESK